MADVVVRNLTKTFGKDRIHRTHSIAFKRQDSQGCRHQLFSLRSEGGATARRDRPPCSSAPPPVLRWPARRDQNLMRAPTPVMVMSLVGAPTMLAS